jgi:hypothetical protein
MTPRPKTPPQPLNPPRARVIIPALSTPDAAPAVHKFAMTAGSSVHATTRTHGTQPLTPWQPSTCKRVD